MPPQLFVEASLSKQENQNLSNKQYRLKSSIHASPLSGLHYLECIHYCLNFASSVYTGQANMPKGNFANP